MPPQRFTSDDPREWLVFAYASLAHARGQGEGVIYELLCFDAQQSAEKALKAVLVARGARPAYTHDLAVLCEHLDTLGVQLPAEVMACRPLTRYASFTRYPTAARALTVADYTDAVAAATAVFRWACDQVGYDPSA